TPDILDMLKINELFPYILDGNESSATSRLGKLLEKWTDRELDGHVLNRQGTRRPAKYRLRRLIGEGNNSSPQFIETDVWNTSPVIPFPIRNGMSSVADDDGQQQEWSSQEGVRVDGCVRVS
ncbi:MAG: hypothetical protein KC931_24250, partial [Candidatus Omnitrophica bacterium]|nr:hypothetical protein [Candidatus Omnitrophota bacterium]